MRRWRFARSGRHSPTAGPPTPTQAIVTGVRPALLTAARRSAAGSRPGRRVNAPGRPELVSDASRAPPPVIYLSYRDRPSPRRDPPAHAPRRGRFLVRVEHDVRELDPLMPLRRHTLYEHVEKNCSCAHPARMFVVLGTRCWCSRRSELRGVSTPWPSAQPDRVRSRWAARPLASSGRLSREHARRRGVRGPWSSRSSRPAPGREPIETAVFIGVPLALLLRRRVRQWLPASGPPASPHGAFGRKDGRKRSTLNVNSPVFSLESCA